MDPALLREREAFKKRAMATPTYVYQYFDYYKIYNICIPI